MIAIIAISMYALKNVVNNECAYFHSYSTSYLADAFCM